MQKVKLLHEEVSSKRVSYTPHVKKKIRSKSQKTANYLQKYTLSFIFVYGNISIFYFVDSNYLFV